MLTEWRCHLSSLRTRRNGTCLLVKGILDYLYNVPFVMFIISHTFPLRYRFILEERNRTVGVVVQLSQVSCQLSRKESLGEKKDGRYLQAGKLNEKESAVNILPSCEVNKFRCSLASHSTVFVQYEECEVLQSKLCKRRWKCKWTRVKLINHL